MTQMVRMASSLWTKRDFFLFCLLRFRYGLFTLLLTLVLSCQVFGQYAHRDVILNAENEALLPAYLKNPHYRTPRIRSALAYYSWFGPGESPVYERAADSITRREIYKVLSHAGLIPRKGGFFR